MKKSTILYLLLLTHLTGFSQHIPYFDTEITTDGVLDEAVWKQVLPFNDFQNFYPLNQGKAILDTDVRIFHDGKNLNIAFVYHDTISLVKVNSLKRDDYGAGFHLSDCIGLIIDPYSNQNKGYFFAVNGKGSQLDALIANYDFENLGWDAIWESGTAVNGTDKIYELKIPLSSFSYDNNISTWSFQFYTRDSKNRLYTVWNKFERGFLQFDTRFLKPIKIDNLEASQALKTRLVPAISANHQNNLLKDKKATKFHPSLDFQYKISDGLRTDLTLNPDFSQVEVDQQVTNLTRFNIVFPEKRLFFVENSDMFTTLGAANNINPFYSRFIGSSQDILMGLKISGNISSKTRIGLLNVHSKKGDLKTSQNYTAAVIKQQLGSIFNSIGYIINRQETDGFSFQDDYNRVTGLKINYLAKNRKWSGFSTYSHSFNDQLKDGEHAFSIENNYNTRSISFSTKVNTVGKNYLTDIGFTPRINNYDAINNTIIREGYTQLFQSILFNHFPENNKLIQSFRPLSVKVSVYLDEDGDISETNYYYNTALFFANQMSTYINLYHDDIKLKYAFDPLRNENLILPGNYKNTAIRLGFNSDYTQSIYGSLNLQLGSFYKGDRTRIGLTTGFRLLPLFSVNFNYEYNTLSFDEIGSQNLHLFGMTTEVFFSNKFNWTTYIQYNEQIDNFNINSRFQWEFRPLSFVYLVFSDNYTNSFNHIDWSVSFKVNRRLDF